jgi:DNA-binding transcriptional regulator YiaG
MGCHEKIPPPFRIPLTSQRPKVLVKLVRDEFRWKDTAFQELLTSIKQAEKIQRGRLKPARFTTFRPTDVKSFCEKLNPSQTEFAIMNGVSVATLRNWEQGGVLCLMAWLSPCVWRHAIPAERVNEFGTLAGGI